MWNKSEIELHWSLGMSAEFGGEAEQLNWFRFVDCDSGETLSQFKPIQAFSYRRIRIALKPKDTGDFCFNLQFENLNDSDNTEVIKVHAVIRSMLREETLLITGAGGANIIDFGDCYTGMWTRQEILLKNISDSPLDIKLGAENANVIFELKVFRL